MDKDDSYLLALQVNHALVREKEGSNIVVAKTG
jgi:hypothetical protein